MENIHGLTLAKKEVDFVNGDFAVAKSKTIDKITGEVPEDFVKILNFDRSLKAYKTENPEGKVSWYNKSQLQATDGDPVVLRSYHETLKLRSSVESLSGEVKDLQNSFELYKNRSLLNQIKNKTKQFFGKISSFFSKLKVGRLNSQKTKQAKLMKKQQKEFNKIVNSIDTMLKK